MAIGHLILIFNFVKHSGGSPDLVISLSGVLSWGPGQVKQHCSLRQVAASKLRELRGPERSETSATEKPALLRKFRSLRNPTAFQSLRNLCFHKMM